MSDQDHHFNGVLSSALDIYNRSMLSWIPNTVLFVFIAVITVFVTRIMSGERLKKSAEAGRGGVMKVPMLPYWIPYVGHSLSFVFFQQRLLSRIVDQFTDGIFSLFVGGKTMNIIYTPQLMHTVFTKSPKILEFDSLTDYIIYNVFGAPKKYRTQISKAMPALKTAVDAHLMREPHLSNTSNAAIKNLEENLPYLVGFVESPVDMMPWERPAAVRNVKGKTGEAAVEAEMLNLITHFIGHVAIPSLFGSDLLGAELNLVSDLFTFNKAFLLIAAGLPRFIPNSTLSAGYAARGRIIDALERWHVALDAHVSNRPEDILPEFSNIEDVSMLMQTRKGIYRAHGIPNHAAAALDLSILWALVANSNFLAFWMLVRLLCDVENDHRQTGGLLRQVREEVAPCVLVQKANDGYAPQSGLGAAVGIETPPRVKIDTGGVLRACPLLKSVYIEACRMDSAPWSFKRVANDFELSVHDQSGEADAQPPRQYRIEKDSYLAVAFDLHFKSPVFFAHPERFQPGRHTQGGSIATFGTVQPYGGGVNMCKGRLFAEREVLACVAGLVTLWDFEGTSKDGTWSMPTAKKATAVNMVKGNVWCKIKKRGW